MSAARLDKHQTRALQSELLPEPLTVERGPSCGPRSLSRDGGRTPLPVRPIYTKTPEDGAT